MHLARFALVYLFSPHLTRFTFFRFATLAMQYVALSEQSGDDDEVSDSDHLCCQRLPFPIVVSSLHRQRNETFDCAKLSHEQVAVGSFRTESESANLLCVIPEHDFFGSSNLRVPWLRLGAFSAIPSDLGNDTDRPCRPYLKTIHLTKPVPHTNNPAKHIPTYPTAGISIRSGASRENGST